eukprot:TRINITY_DN65233_c0_g1_i1.p1 TRINITY_DN65233_c0_g1~~TRINITY_DN65233_c0_g1_i1.p1  ORF type:complete len:643 (-),score=92.31 TRINITY_DN65233_c0_g1_i1:1257-3185(-)
MQKVKEMSSKGGGQKDPKSAYRVILNVNEDSSTSPRLAKGKKSSRSTFPDPHLGNETATVAVTRLGKVSNEGTKLLPIQIPKPQAPVFKSHPKLFSREFLSQKQQFQNRKGKKVITESTTNVEDVFNFPNEFHEKQDELSSTYSVKYLGITNGKIGILSRRVPIPIIPKEKPERSAILFHVKPKVQKLPPMTVSTFEIPKKVVKEVLQKPPEPVPEVVKEKVEEAPKETEPEKEEEEEERYQNKFSGNIPAYVPIGTTTINDMFASAKYLASIGDNEQRELPEITPQQPEPTTKTPASENKDVPKVKHKPKKPKKSQHKTPLHKPNTVNKEVKKQQVPEKPAVPKVKPKTTNPSPSFPGFVYKVEKLRPKPSPAPLPELEPAKPVENPPPDDDLIPHPEKYNEHLVHTYSLPKALPVCRKVKVYSEAEMFDQEKYSKESVISAVYSKTSGIMASKRQGFKGTGLPIGELHKTKQLLSKSRSGMLGTSGPVLGNTNALELNATNPKRRISKETPFVLENVIIKEKTLSNFIEDADKTQNVKLPEIAGKETVELLEKVREQKLDPEEYVNENNKLINLLLSEGATGKGNDNIEEEEFVIGELDEEDQELEKIEEEDTARQSMKVLESAPQLKSGQTAQVQFYNK